MRRVVVAAAGLLLLGACGSTSPPAAAPTTAPATSTPSAKSAPTTAPPTTAPPTAPPTTRPPTAPPTTPPPTTRPPTPPPPRPALDVAALQRRLAALRYDVPAVTGRYDATTRHAVTAFQKVSGLPRTGTADAATLARLATATTPRPRYARTGTAIEVDIGRQVLLAVRDGTVVRVYDVSTGRPSIPTPISGATPFRIWRKALSGSTGYGDVERYVSYYKAGTLLAIHGYGYVPPFPASHGCVRVPTDGAARLYATTYVGEPVYTYR